MLPLSLNNLLRVCGITISALIAIIPWLISPGSEDPFLFQGWVVFAAGSLALCLLSVIFLFFRPRQNQVPYTRAFLLFFAVITLSTLSSQLLISLRTALIWASFILLVGFLRLSRHQADNLLVATILVLSGFIMAIYGLMQALGYDVISWASDYKIVGTLSNPNFYTIFLATTAVMSIGLSINQSYRYKSTRIIFMVMSAIQILAILAAGRAGTILALIFGIFLLCTSFWEVRPGRLLRRSPFISGLLISLLIVAAHGLIYYASSTYPWSSSSKFSYHDFPIITRIINWQMGYAIFINEPLIGHGPGTVPYLMPLQRPPTGSAMGLKQYNDDPHSWPITLMGETGFFGLFLICSILAIAYGCATWRRFKSQQTDELLRTSNDSTTQSLSFADDNLSFKLFIFAILASLAAYWLGLIGSAPLLYSIPAAILIFAIHNLFRNMTNTESTPQPVGLAKITLVALLTMVFHGLYNNTFSILPLQAFAALLFSLLFSVCLRNIAWKRRFSFLSLLYICLPALYVFTTYNLQIAYQREQLNLALGETQLSAKNFSESQAAFESAIQANPQSLKAHYGLALSLERQNRLDETQDILKRLDEMVPNVFNTNYELARILFKRQQILDAHKYALKSLRWNQTPRTYDLLGRILLMEGKPREAEKIFEEGLIMIPPDRREHEAADRIRLNLAALLSSQGDFEQCRNYLEEIKGKVKNDPDYVYLSGMLLVREQKHQQALDIFEKALTNNPHDTRLMNAVGYILTTLNQDLERAADLLETAYQKIRKQEPPPLSDLLMVAHSLGTLYWKQGKLSEAHALLELAWSQCPPEWVSLRKERRESLRRFYQETGKNDELQKLEEMGARSQQPKEQK